MTQSLRLDIYWSFRSPYSYLAIDRLADIRATFHVDAKMRFVRPLAMREPDFFERGRPQFLPYLFKDAPREAERAGVPFGLPSPDPIDMDMGSGKVAPAQPKMNRLMALGVAMERAGAGMAFAQVIGRAIWGGRLNWHEDEALGEAIAQAGGDAAAIAGWIEENSDEIGAIIDANEAEQLKHHWGVPLMVLDEEPFFGQDRLDSLVWRLEKLGAHRA